jgi:hypothetical protein
MGLCFLLMTWVHWVAGFCDFAGLRVWELGFGHIITHVYSIYYIKGRGSLGRVGFLGRHPSTTCIDFGFSSLHDILK